MAARVVCLVLIIQGVYGIENRASNDGIMDRLSNGMKFAQNFLGSESVALKVAEFVVRAFQTANTPRPSNIRNPYSSTKHDHKDQSIEEEDPLANESKPNYNVNEGGSPLTPLRHLVKLFGLQPSQISAVAVNALLFVAQMISTFLSGPPRPGRPHRADDSLSWILNKRSQTLQDLLTTARNESLPDIIEDLIKDQGSNEDISCVKLLICKITPFVSKMQKAVFGEQDGLKTGAGVSALYRHLPTKTEINERSDICDQKHKDCDLTE